jgi:ribosomal protein S18 acetylase RimI-like enzyme
LPSHDALALERLAYEGWPAEEVKHLGGWRLRHTRGVTLRANSAWTCATEGSLSLGHRIAAVERFYADRAAPPVFQLGALAPRGLDAALTLRGYQRKARVSLQVACIDEVARPRGPRDGGPHVTVDGSPGTAWWDLCTRRGRFADAEDVLERILGRLGTRALFALGEAANGEPAAIGLGVVQGAWLGVFSMRTLPEHRCQGLGRAVLAALAHTGRAQGVENVYLQVEIDNPSALALYRHAGFRGRAAHHYRVGPTPA